MLHRLVVKHDFLAANNSNWENEWKNVELSTYYRCFSMPCTPPSPIIITPNMFEHEFNEILSQMCQYICYAN